MDARLNLIIGTMWRIALDSFKTPDPLKEDKRESDKVAKAMYLISIEQDDLKRFKMENRLNNGITDFSDL